MWPREPHVYRRVTTLASTPSSALNGSHYFMFNENPFPDAGAAPSRAVFRSHRVRVAVRWSADSFAGTPHALPEHIRIIASIIPTSSWDELNVTPPSSRILEALPTGFPSVLRPYAPYNDFVILHDRVHRWVPATPYYTSVRAWEQQLDAFNNPITQAATLENGLSASASVFKPFIGPSGSPPVLTEELTTTRYHYHWFHTEIDISEPHAVVYDPDDSTHFTGHLFVLTFLNGLEHQHFNAYDFWITDSASFTVT